MFSQKLIREEGYFIYGDERICDYENLEPIISTNLEALSWLLKSRKSNSSAFRMGVISLAGLGGSALLIHCSMKGIRDPKPGQLVVGLGIGLTACIIGMAGIAEKSIAGKEETMHWIFSTANWKRLM